MRTRTQTKYKITLHWRDGKIEECEGWGASEGEAVADAMNAKGYGYGALRALDYYAAEVQP